MSFLTVRIVGNINSTPKIKVLGPVVAAGEAVNQELTEIQEIYMDRILHPGDRTDRIMGTRVGKMYQLRN